VSAKDKRTIVLRQKNRILAKNKNGPLLSIRNPKKVVEIV
jgi:hypothetical protein